MPPIIQTNDLHKNYGDTAALQDLNLEIEEGNCVGLLGPNGAGKSTLIKILCGLSRPTKGSALIKNVKPYNNRKRVLKDVGSIVENPEYYANFNPKDILQYLGEIYGMEKSQLKNRIEEVIETVGLSDSADRPIKEFSRGMKQRLTFGQAILHDPPLLILDEPSLGLDPKGVQEIRELIKSFVKSGKTILLASHQLPEVQKTCGEVALLNEGELLVYDEVKNLEEVLEAPKLSVKLVENLPRNRLKR